MRFASCVHPLLFFISCFTRSTSAAECSWNVECEELHAAGSVCREDGTCSNPYAAGCLYNFYEHYGKLSDTPEKRVCNSDDHDETHCKVSPFNYTEIRVHNGNWESPIFYSWIIQIFLSEFLHVPVTVGLSNDTQEASFYNADSVMTWSSQTYAFEEFITANEMFGRCDLTDKQCVHVIPEVWIGQEKKWKRFLSEDHIDQVNGDGQIGKISWYVPFATAKRYPEVTSFHGLEDRRGELAAVFLRPTTWGDYCNQESPSGCQEEDGVASRAPGEGEEDMYFLDGIFTGYFRATAENNCTAFPDECTGHIVAPPCTWSTNVDAQTVHNDIALESNGPLQGNHGYSYGQMIQIWRAANATDSDLIMWWWTPDATIEEFRGTEYEFQPVLLPEPTAECRKNPNATDSDLIMWWWTPDATIEEFRGTEYEFQPVLLPEPTAECRENRIEPEDRCSVYDLMRQGQPLGGCDNEANDLKMVIASSLRDMSYNASEVERSPGYEALRNLKVSHLDMNVMLGQWAANGRTGFAAREAVCSWVTEHLDELESFIPHGFPRTIVEYTKYNEPLLYVAISCAVLAFVYVLVAWGMVYTYRRRKVFVFAQIPFVNMVLGGLLLVTITAFLFALEPSATVCTSRVWFLSLGYTLELVPLLVKVAAINRLMAATKRMRRVQISMQSLYATVAVVNFFVLIFLMIWTVVDKPYGAEGRYLTDDNEISTSVTCQQDSPAWEMIVLLWNGILIVCASMLAFQSRNVKQEFNESQSLGSRNVKQEFNESQSLGVMIYSHFVLLVLFVVIWLVGQGGEDEMPTFDQAKARAACSILMSFDVVSAVTIYIVPKVLQARMPQRFNPSVSYQDSEDGGPSFESGYHSSTSSNVASASTPQLFQPIGGKRPAMPSMPSINEGGEEGRESSYSGTSGKCEDSEERKESFEENVGNKPETFVPRFSRVSVDGSLTSPPSPPGAHADGHTTTNGVAPTASSVPHRSNGKTDDVDDEGNSDSVHQ
eukprot:Nitzschia sp. Nitz4//scaffold138_size62050//40663//43710//NITZ4_006392-RA/size62050-processed-gene-0.8-mRNA-1//1//CDS//3329535779//7425//frame0